MIREIYGKKIGMTQVFDAEGNQIPVTLVEVEPVYVLEKCEYSTKTRVKIGCFKVEDKKISKIKKPELGYFNKLGVTPYRLVREVAVEKDAEFSFTKPDLSKETGKQSKVNDLAVPKESSADTKSNNSSSEGGSQQKSKPEEDSSADSKVESNPRQIGVEVFSEGDIVDVRAKTKGKGFTGGMKRHNWSGQPASHGSTTHRRVGSIGASAYPSRVMKGVRMPGHMGNAFRTTKELKVIKVDTEKALLFIKGGVPGARGTIVRIRKAR